FRTFFMDARELLRARFHRSEKRLVVQMECGEALLSCLDDFIGHIGHCSRSEEHTSELQSQSKLVCRLLLEKKKTPPTKRSAIAMMAVNMNVTRAAFYWLRRVPYGAKTPGNRHSTITAVQVLTGPFLWRPAP